MLGDKWEVRNYGVCSATMLHKGDKPYRDQKEYVEALGFNPHAVIIMLGTNDTKPMNWAHKDEFMSDYLDMIHEFQALDSDPKVVLCLPAPAYPERWGISDKVIKEEVIPRIERVAEISEVPIIDLYKPLTGMPERFPDQIHPDADGAGIMVKEILKVLK
jgi:lysophospholipase L1-like esterase